MPEGDSLSRMSDSVITTNRLSANDILVRGAAIERRVRNVGLITSIQLDKAETRLDLIMERLDNIQFKLDILMNESMEKKACCECCSIQ
jgi:hypothetical protein